MHPRTSPVPAVRWLPLPEDGDDGRRALRVSAAPHASGLRGGGGAALAIGIGAAAAMFGLIQGVLLSPPPYADPDRLVLVSPARIDGQPYERGVDVGQWLAWRRRRRVERAGALPLDLQLPGPRRRQPVARRHGRHAATTSACSASGRSSAGRSPRRAGAAEGRRRPPSIIGYDLWQREFGGDPDIIGRRSRSAGCRRRCRSSA